MDDATLDTIQKKVEELYAFIKSIPRKNAIPEPIITDTGDVISNNHLNNNIKFQESVEVQSEKVDLKRNTLNSSSLTSRSLTINENRKNESIEERNGEIRNGNFDNLKYPNVVLNNPIDFSLSYVHSTRHFYIFLDYSAFEKFYCDLNKVYNEKNKNDIQVGSQLEIGKVYVLFYDEDECYYRVQLIEHLNDGKIKIFFIDTGETMPVSKAKLYKLLPEFDVPVFALNCFIDVQWKSNFQLLDTALMHFINEGNLFYQEIKGTLQQPIRNKYPILIIFKDHQDAKKTFVNGVFDLEVTDAFKTRFNVKEFLKDEDLAFDFELIKIAYDKLNSLVHFENDITFPGRVCVIKVIDISNFLVAGCAKNQGEVEVDNFITNLSLFYAGSHNFGIENPQPKDIIVVKRENYYFRALVLKSSSNQLEVFAFDVGQIFSVGKSNAFILFEKLDLNRFPPMTIACGLHNLIPFNGTSKGKWSLLAVSNFEKICKQPVDIKMINYCDGKFTVEVTSDNLSVNSFLKKCRLAKDQL